MYIVFSLIIEDESEVKGKVSFILKWLREHAKNKLAGVHACKEDKRVKYTNEKLARK